MVFMGIDLGTTGCKAVLFDVTGKAISSDYREYKIISDNPGQAELDPWIIWNYVKEMIIACLSSNSESLMGISVSSLGEAVVPVSAERKPLANSLLNFDTRGSEYLPWLHDIISDEDLYSVNGNPMAPSYGLTKLLWYQRELNDVYEKSYKLLLWSSYILYMMGAEPVVDYALANRTLLLDIEKKEWNSSLIDKIGFNIEKLPDLTEAGSVCGKLSMDLAEEFGLIKRTLLIVGTHDQCANAIGCGVLEPGIAMYGMGTYHCIVSVFKERQNSMEMLSRGLNTEHHAVRDQWVSFIYNQGGILLKWFRDTFASEATKSENQDIYTDLLSEMPDGPSSLSVLPHFITTGTPDFLEKTSGIILGLTINSHRGDILKAILEGIAFYLKENLDNLPEEMSIIEFRVAGGGSKSDVWMQLTADILERPCVRTKISEAGSLGAAVLAAKGSGVFKTLQEAVDSMVTQGQRFMPDKSRSIQYQKNYERYKELYPLFGSFLSQYKQ